MAPESAYDGVKLNLHMRADVSGLLHVEKAEAVVEIEETYTVKVGARRMWRCGSTCPEHTSVRVLPAHVSQAGHTRLLASREPH